MRENPSVLKVSIASPLRRLFEYLPTNDIDFDDLQPGMRLEVPFGHRKTVGLLVEKTRQAEFDQDKLKSVGEVIDTNALLSDELLALLKWVARYYHHPPGEVFFSALPTLLRKKKSLQNAMGKAASRECWQLTSQGRELDLAELGRASKQIALLEFLRSHEGGADSEQLNSHFSHWRNPMKGLLQKQLVNCEQVAVDLASASTTPTSTPRVVPALNDAQKQAVDTVLNKAGQFHASLLEGVTGSGKTEVYLHIIDSIIAQGKQALVLVPEIGLTPQMLSRFQSRFDCPIAVFHSGLNEHERLSAWLMAKNGTAPVIIGTRSAVFTPADNLGVIILDEEHDLSFKQQEGFRYSARDVAIKRAHQNNIPVLLGSATPSLECLYNVDSGRYSHLVLPERATGAAHPAMELVDLRAVKMQEGISPALFERMKQHLDRDNQVLLFLNRRGFAPALLCHDCGWVSHCQRCDANMTIHRHDNRQRCHHCSAERPLPAVCPECQSEQLHTYGVGTERVEQALASLFPGVDIIRMDRDTTRRKGAFEALLDKISQGKKQILIGTQLLAKGHHFPNVTLVGILNADNELFSSDFRATERMAQQIIQVAGRAGREDKPGEVMIQTHQPQHPLLQTLVHHGYRRFAQALMKERREAQLPPFSYHAMLRAEAVDLHAPTQFLSQVKQLLSQHAVNQGSDSIELVGPLPAPMEKRAGRYRAQLLLQSDSRAALHILLEKCMGQVESMKFARKVRWSLDVDPMESL